MKEGECELHNESASSSARVEKQARPELHDFRDSMTKTMRTAQDESCIGPACVIACVFCMFRKALSKPIPTLLS